MVRLRPKSPLALLVAVVAVAACLPGARAPNVPPQRTLELSGAEIGGKGSSAPFGVVFAGPKGKTVDPTEVTVVFNRPMRPLELAGEESAPPARIEPAQKGAWRWLGTSALAFVPEKALPRATKFEVTVPGGTKALDGSTLAKDYVFDFSTPGPHVVHVTPGDGSTHLTPKQSFEVRFNQPVDPKEVARATKMVANEKTNVAFAVERPKPDVPMLVKLVPRAPLPLDSKIEIVVDGSLHGLEGPLPSGEESRTHVETYGPLAVREASCARTDKNRCHPHGSVFVGLSNRVPLKDLRAHVRIEPPLPIKWPKGGRSEDDKVDWTHVPVDIPPAASFRVVVTAGLKDEFGQVLARDHVTTLTSDDESPNVTIGLSGEVFEAAKAKGREVPVAAVNVSSYELVTAAADEAGVVKLRAMHRPVEHRWSAAKALPGAKTEDVRPGGPRNVNAIKNVSIDGLLGAQKNRGAIVIGTLRPPPPGGRAPIRELQVVSVTDLALSARLSRFGSVVFVSHLSDGKPVGGAIVAARDASGREVASAKTDASGFATFAPSALAVVNEHGSIDEDLVLFARSGDDWTFRAAVDTVARAELPYVDLAARLSTFGMLFTDRGIYKAGEKIELKGVFRKPLPRGMETPVGREVTLRAMDRDGATMFEHKAKLGAFGEVATEIPIPATARLGHVEIDAIVPGEKPAESWEPRAATVGVEIAAYRPAEFKTSVEPDRPAYVRGDKASFVVRGDYLFGAPMSGGKVRTTVTRSRTSFSPEGSEAFVVDDDAYSWAHPDASLRGGKLQSGDGVLDAKGTYTASVPLALAKQTGPENVGIEAEIEDLSRQTVASQSTALVHPAEFYVGLRRPKEAFPAAGAPVKIEVAAIEPGGKHRAGVPMQIELVERTWTTATEAVGEEDFHYESRAVDTVVGRCDATTTADAGACELQPKGPGYFVVRAKATDKRGNPVAASYPLYVVGEGARIAWPMYDSARLELVTDKKSYEVGDTATILIKSPYKEADAIVTVERQGVHQQRRIALRGAMPTVQVPVTSEMWPNAFVSVELIKPRTAPPKDKGQDAGAPSYRLGYAEIVVNPEGRRLDVKVKPSKKDFRPGDEVDVDLVVTGRDGKGVRADVAFYAVDEGVLMLTGYKTPDPLPVFAAKRPLSVLPLESRDDLARIVRLGRAPGVDKGDEGGGGGEGLSAREDFRTTAFFAPSVVTAADGKAHVRFKLPDSLTTYRLMAVASAEDHRFGFGQDQVVTSRPLMARPALPRFLRAGDAIEAGVIVTTKGLPAQRVEVKLDAKGVQVVGEPTKVIDVPPSGSVEVRWPIVAPNAGAASFAFTARASGGSDAVTVPREVKVPLSLEAVALYGDTEAAIAEKLGDMRAMRTDAGGLDLRVASTALVGLDDGVEALLEYPYGCTEQVTSRLVPLVALVDLARDYGIKLPEKADRAADEAIAKVLKNQRPDGGFGYWADSEKADVWVTAYALWALSLAKERGRPVPPDAIESATKWLRDQIAACGVGSTNRKGRARASELRWCADVDVALAQHAFVVDVLAMTGKPDAGYVSRLFEQRERMPLFARALLAHAMVLSKLRLEDAKELVRDAENHLRVTPAGATIAENLGDRYAPLLDSEARTTAIVLRTLVTVDPQHPLAARLAKGLLAARRGGAWRSTQENAWSLVALDAYRKAQEAKEPDFDAQVFFGDQLLFTAPFHGRSTKSKSESFAASKIAGRGGEALAFQVNGKGRLFYEARLRYAKKELPDAPLDRGFFVRKLVRSVRPEALSDALRTLPQASSTSANASDLVLVDLLVVTPDPREQVVIDDPLPAGLEPVQSALATTARDLAVGEPGEEPEPDDRDERAMGRAFLQTWYHREFHDDRVLTFVDHMPAGMAHYRYLARATTPGKFVVPPTKAECMYEPETFGRTAAATFEVKVR